MVSLKPFKSTTLEGAFLEAAFLLEKIETGLNNYKVQELKFLERKIVGEINDPKVKADIEAKKLLLVETKYFSITIDTDQQRCVIVATLPARIKENSFGGYLLAKEFFTDDAVSKISADTLEQL